MSDDQVIEDAIEELLTIIDETIAPPVPIEQAVEIVEGVTLGLNERLAAMHEDAG